MRREQEPEHIRQDVRQRYGDIARQQRATCCCSSSACCSGRASDEVQAAGARLGYSRGDLAGVPEPASMSLGCGNPSAIASLRPGEVVLDLGCGAGLDCFLAARQVGETGRVIGVDMTPEMLAKARQHAARLGIRNVEFRLGEIEHLPVADKSVDVIISNCVINLSPDKPAVFREAHRVLKPGGRLAIADVVATAPLPDAARQDMALWSACISGAACVDDLEAMLREAGFGQIRIAPQDSSREMIREWASGRDATEYVLSATIEAIS